MGIYVGPGDGELLGTSTVIKVTGDATGGALAVVETSISPRGLIEQHVHANDVWIYVLQGHVGVLVGDEVAEGSAGTWLLKPHDIPHAMWNPRDVPALLTPAGSEGYFREAGQQPDRNAFDAMAAGYGIRFMRDADWNRVLRERFGLT